MAMDLPRYGVVVPVKRPTVAKSRLAGLGDEVRRALAAAFAADTVAAVLACELVDEVLAVTDDHGLAAELVRLGAGVIPDGAADDLNATVEQAAAELVRRRPDLRIAAVCADLPALRPAELGAALAAAADDRMCFVADVEERGTTLVTAPDLDRFRPRFGPTSRRAHLDARAEELRPVGVPGLRRDVDTPDDLRDALALGVGSRTAAVAGAPASVLEPHCTGQPG